MVHQGNLVRSGVDSVLVSYDHTKTVNHLRHYVNALIMKIMMKLCLLVVIPHPLSGLFDGRPFATLSWIKSEGAQALLLIYHFSDRKQF